jgi:nucleotide-binding universal stress UspA family protein
MSEQSDKNMIVMVATDFSEPARKAADAAAALASAKGGSIMLVHVHHPMAVADLPELPGLAAQTLQAAAGALESEASRLAATGIDVKSEFLEGPPGRRLLEAAKSCHPDLVVLGSKRRKVIERWLLGDVAEYVAEHADVPTLIVRNADPIVKWVTKLDPLRILVGQNLKEPSDNSLLWVKSVAGIGPTKTTVAYVTWPYDEARRYGFPVPATYFDSSPELMELVSRDLTRRVERLAGELGAETIVKSSWVGADVALGQLAKETQADVLVLGKRQHRALFRFIEHSVSRSTMHDTSANLAIIPSTAEPASQRPINRFQRILVATDFSTDANRAIPVAYGMVGQGGVVCLAHICDKDDASLHDAEARLWTLVPEESRSMGIQSEVSVAVSDKASTGILQLVNRFGADAVCLTSHSHSELAEALVRSPSRDLLRAIRVPILMIHAEDS